MTNFRKKLFSTIILSALLSSGLPVHNITGVNQSVAEANQNDFELVGSADISIGTSLETIRQHIGIENGVRAELDSGDGHVIAYYQSDLPRLTVALMHDIEGSNYQNISQTGAINYLGYGEDLDFMGFYQVNVTMYDDSVSEPEPEQPIEEDEEKDEIERVAVNGVYTIQKGDSLPAIAESFNMGLAQLMGYNDITNLNEPLVVGDQLIVSEVSQDNSLLVSRIQGANRFETAALISQEGFDKADTVVIANAREFADALAGVPLAYQKDAPILLAQGNRLNGSIVEEIERLGATEAVILGGEAAVNANLEGHLTSLGLKTTRLAGDNRFETSVAIAEELENYVNSSEAIFVDGFQFADAMSIAPFAAQEGMPIFLTRTHSLSVKEAADQFDRTIIVGGENAVSKTVESRLNNPTRLAGSDRYKTNVAVMEHFGVSSTEFFLSTGLEFADALTGSVLAAKNGSAVGLVRNGISSDLDHFISENTFERFTLFGGPNAINKRIETSLIK